MKDKPTKYKEWIESRREFMTRAGWALGAVADDDFAEEYKEMLITLKRECTVAGIAALLGSCHSTIQKDRHRLGITAMTIRGQQVPPRYFVHNNRLMTCQQIADMHGCCYSTAYARLTMGEWIP